MKNLNTTMRIGIFALLLVSSELFGVTTRSNVNLVEASEDIKLISQKIVKDYFYFSQNTERSEVKQNLDKAISALDDKLRLIAIATKSEDTKNLLAFLSYSREQIGETIAQPYDQENGALMLDYSETLLEGAESIAYEYRYDFTPEEKMLINVKTMAYLIERITKYYMAFQVGFNDLNNIRQLQEAVTDFDTYLKMVNTFDYEGETAGDLAVLNQYWVISKKFYLTLDKRKLPNIIYLSARHLERSIEKLELYHSKNQ